MVVEISIICFTIFAIALLVVIAIIMYREHSDNVKYIRYRNDREEDDEMITKRMILEYKMEVEKLKLKNAQPTVNDPKPVKASDTELAEWFELMTNPDKLFEETNTKEE